ncbi:protein TolQ [Pelodictyon phaeoclathratiforme]|jgi:biopolymer transport protein TolQ|uniref:Protein TolQ n=1 Tax=Pelodictyon phaeoclathratiforme (strain DSM 5477 / BU-1) TaxID=324925 RepID=B4SDJ9_PELPB|nr:protein TolQ [Pelodictyon phaeoclathratiforme]ACF44367.1 protein TolQ [Pelodictyon phaeoclathratiforme BU-1]MBV5289420.1 protein TolQ [Pelodictyon phaeoclathratiforme]
MFDSRLGIFGLFSDAGPVVLMVLSILLAFSVISWAIIAFKFGYLRKSLRESRLFLDYFFAVSNVDKVFTECENFRTGSLPRVFRACYIEYRSLGDKSDLRQGRARIARAMKREVNAENKRLSTLVPFLATVGNTAPFIGLFGTVWGIMNSFQNIGMTQSASLAAVAPGISEALIATAAGLAAAIPAVMGYNFFAQQIGMIERDLEEFSPEFVSAFINEP